MIDSESASLLLQLESAAAAGLLLMLLLQSCFTSAKFMQSCCFNAAACGSCI
jgi:hypothetical protein